MAEAVRIYRTKAGAKEKAPEEIKEKKKLRVCAYARVSTAMEAQNSSIEVQVSTYEERIRSNPDWEFAGIYADHGASGTQASKRTEFMRMINDCRAGKIDRILTKSISRFARNTLDCIQYVRELSSLGVTVLFEKENIDTGSAYSEMLLTVMAAFAQEESRSISANVTWGIRKRYSSGQDKWTNIYGYMKDQDRTYIIVEDEAKVIRRIFDLYEHGTSNDRIAEILNEEGIKAPNRAKKWQQSFIYSILINEKYAGDILLQKVYTDDPLKHSTVVNDGEKIPMFFIKDHHTPIIAHEQFDRVQKMLKWKSRTKDGTISYPYGDEYLRCPYCGALLQPRQMHIGHRRSGWHCDHCHKFVMEQVPIDEAVLKALQKKNPAIESVEYFWLDTMVDRIDIGKHEDALNKTITVHWKDGTQTKVSTGITENFLPSVLAERTEMRGEFRDEKQQENGEEDEAEATETTDEAKAAG